MSSENRSRTRKIANEVLEVEDHLTASVIGQVVNISTEGFMLVGHEPLDEGSVYQLDLLLPKTLKERNKVFLGAEVIWTKETERPDSYWSGLQIIDISEEDLDIIQALIKDWSP